MPRPTTTTDIERFAAEYIIDLNITRAAERAGIARRTAFEMMKRDEVLEAIERHQAARMQRTQITADEVLRHVHAIATCDANELIQVRRGCCRYCHGTEHLYQYRDKRELAIGRRQFEASDEGLVEPFKHGGTGFMAQAEPHPDCPECGGEGSAYVYVTDTRHLSPAARALYAGAKQTKDGIEVRFNSRDKHLELLMRHLGLLNDKLEVKGELGLVERILKSRKQARGS